MDYGANFPAGTFDFSKTYNSLLKSFESVSVENESFRVTFVVTNTHYGTNFFTRDTNVVRSLFDTAKTHCKPRNVEVFETLWKKTAPFQ